MMTSKVWSLIENNRLTTDVIFFYYKLYYRTGSSTIIDLFMNRNFKRVAADGFGFHFWDVLRRIANYEVFANFENYFYWIITLLFNI